MSSQSERARLLSASTLTPTASEINLSQTYDTFPTVHDDAQQDAKDLFDKFKGSDGFLRESDFLYLLEYISLVEGEEVVDALGHNVHSLITYNKGGVRAGPFVRELAPLQAPHVHEFGNCVAHARQPDTKSEIKEAVLVAFALLFLPLMPFFRLFGTNAVLLTLTDMSPAKYPAMVVQSHVTRNQTFWSFLVLF